MCNINRPTTLFITFIISCLPNISSAFSTTSLAQQRGTTHDANSANFATEKTRQSYRKVRLFAEPNSESSSCSRRGFINSCIAATAACSAIAVSPAYSMPQTENDAPVIKSNINNPINSSSRALISSNESNNNVPIPTAFQESISGFVSGSAVSTVKTLVKYPLDTATVRLQMPSTLFTIENLPALFAGSLDGITAPLLSNIPAGAIFFAVKDATKSSLKESGLGLPKWPLTSLAVAAALPPYWLIRNPSEVVKTRLQVGAEGYYEGMSTYDAFQLALSNGNSTMDGVSELYQGFSENILYGFPADIIKFVAYDSLTGGKGKNGVSPLDGAVYGAFSTAIAQLVTTPLDVLRNRIMAEVPNDDDDSKSTVDNASYIDRLTKIAKEEGVQELFAGTTPRIAKAVLSGAIQFATYEVTKKKLSEFFIKR
mmetsp:Transcript_29057/g.61845  ORF Transcript_29057/g.61845 Transcript_29057/m.61845 type:complete len:427 (+) Transcript_29057:198-1478(+)